MQSPEEWKPGAFCRVEFPTQSLRGSVPGVWVFLQLSRRGLLWGQSQPKQWDVLCTQNMNCGESWGLYDVAKGGGMKRFFSTGPFSTLCLCPTFHALELQAKSRLLSPQRTIQ